MKDLLPLTLLFVVLGLIPPSHALAPGRLPVNGHLRDSQERPLEGAHSITFRLYSSPEDGEPLFEERQTLTLHHGSFFTQLGQESPLDLSLFGPDTPGLWLGLSVNEDVEFRPRLRLGDVPVAAWAYKAGQAIEAEHANRATLAEHSELAQHALSTDESTLAQRALEAENAEDTLRFEGRLVGEFRLGDDPIPFSEISEQPAGLADGDDDTLASLNCAPGHFTVFDGTAWTCAFPLAGKGCQSGQLLVGVDASGEAVCADDRDEDTTYSGAHFALSNQLCDEGQILQGIDGAGQKLCVAHKDSTYSGTDFLLSDQGCGDGFFFRGTDSEGQKICEEESTYSGAHFALSDQLCPEGEFFQGIDEEGLRRCTADQNATYDHTVFARPGQSCAPGFFVSGIDPTGQAICARESTYSSAEFARPNQLCPEGERLKGFDDAGQKICATDLTPEILFASQVAGGDLSGHYPAPSVSRLQGKDISDSAPADDDSLVYKGGRWAPEAKTAMSGVYKKDNAAATSYGLSVGRYVVEAGPSVVGVVQPLDVGIMDAFCRDLDGCSITVQMLNYSADNDIATRTRQLHYSSLSNWWRTSDHSDRALDDNNVINELAFWDCFFTDAETSKGTNNERADERRGFGFLNVRGEGKNRYPDATTICRLVIED